MTMAPSKIQDKLQEIYWIGTGTVGTIPTLEYANLSIVTGNIYFTTGISHKIGKNAKDKLSISKEKNIGILLLNVVSRKKYSNARKKNNFS